MDKNILLNPYYESILKYDSNLRNIRYDLVAFGKLPKNIYESITKNAYSHVYFIDIFGGLNDLRLDQFKNLKCLVTENPHIDITENLDFDYANADNTYVFYTNNDFGENLDSDKTVGSFLESTDTHEAPEPEKEEDTNDYTFIDTSEFSTDEYT